MWQVALPMTSNPKAVQNGQRSSPNSFQFWGREILRIGQEAQPPLNPERQK
jgi:hypothetical protein